MQNPEQVKAAIRRRLFLRHKRDGTTPPAHIAEWFVTCPECEGSGTFCEVATDEAGKELSYGYGYCPPCDGTGFVERKR